MWVLGNKTAPGTTRPGLAYWGLDKITARRTSERQPFAHVAKIEPFETFKRSTSRMARYALRCPLLGCQRDVVKRDRVTRAGGILPAHCEF